MIRFVAIALSDCAGKLDPTATVQYQIQEI
jgi:hypothetical protein